MAPRMRVTNRVPRRQRPRAILVCLVAAFAAASSCARHGTPDVQVSPASDTLAAAPLLPPVIDLSGQWYTGQGPEPDAPRMVLHPACSINPAAWVLQQRGNDISAWTFAESFNQGIVSPGPGPEVNRGTPGTISGADVILDDGVTRYVLRYDAASEHLRGTRNGAAFWAVRQTVVRLSACPGVP